MVTRWPSSGRRASPCRDGPAALASGSESDSPPVDAPEFHSVIARDAQRSAVRGELPIPDWVAVLFDQRELFASDAVVNGDGIPVRLFGLVAVVKRHQRPAGRVKTEAQSVVGPD